MDFEEAIVAGIVAQYFQPQPGFTTTIQPDGSTHPQIYYNQAPAMAVALQLFEAKKQEILTAVIESFDAERVAAFMTGKILRGLDEKRPGYSSTPTAGEAFQKEVRTRVVEMLAQIKTDAILNELSGEGECPV